MDFDQLKTFLEVSRQKSFSRAAVKLLVTQPSISAQISSLEKAIGVRLFERGGGKVTLTAAGPRLRAVRRGLHDAAESYCDYDCRSGTVAAREFADQRERLDGAVCSADVLRQLQEALSAGVAEHCAGGACEDDRIGAESRSGLRRGVVAAVRPAAAHRGDPRR